MFLLNLLGRFIARLRQVLYWLFRWAERHPVLSVPYRSVFPFAFSFLGAFHMTLPGSRCGGAEASKEAKPALQSMRPSVTVPVKGP